MNNIRSFLFYVAISFILLLCSVSCSTRKNTFSNRTYHTITSKYNVNFNGNEALKKGLDDLSKKQEDNYTIILPIYYYPPKENLGSALPSFDKAIEKASKSIYKHSMLIRGKEYVKTMDDAYFMMGQAYFNKQDYVQAQRVLFYIANQYKDWGLAEQAIILNARCALRQKYYSRSLALLEEANYLVYTKKSKKLNLLYNAASAEYHLTAPDGDKDIAIDNLLEALNNKPKKDFRNRLYFILGQLYEEIGEPKNAQKYFYSLLKSTPPYSMEFSARMHLASNYDGTPESKELITKEFKKMLDEVKNENYKDQIYYALSEMARIDENVDERKDFLSKSVATSTANNYQKTFSSVLLADIYFDENEYVKAQAYYDTALMSIPKDYPNNVQISQKATILKDLVDNLQVIELQDSLQRIAKMTPQQRTAWVKKMINIYTEEERRLAKEESDRMLLLQSTSSFANVNVNTSGSTEWYFYNPGLVSAGATEFFRKFGNRKLEDNWLISNKQQISFEDMDNMNTGADTVAQYDEDGNLIVQRETDPKKDAFYTQDLPLTPGAVDTSNILIKDAMYNAALIYYDQLKDMPRANEMFEQLIQRFPKCDYVLPSYYLLYINYLKNNPQKSDEYKNIILTQYSESDYARLIEDPDYYKKLVEKNKVLEKKYESIYGYYTNKQWKEVLSATNEIIPNCTDKDLKPKFEYLRAVAVGQVQGVDSLKLALSKIIINYPNTGVAELAKIYLSNYGSVAQSLANAGDTTQQKIVEQQTIATESPFKFNPAEQHYIVLIVNVHKFSVADLKNELAAFNREFFSLQKFNINSFYINQNEQLITISKFKAMQPAMDYYEILVRNEKFRSSVMSGDIKVYPMGAINYTTYYNKVDKRGLYEDFFKVNYKPQDINSSAPAINQEGKSIEPQNKKGK